MSDSETTKPLVGEKASDKSERNNTYTGPFSKIPVWLIAFLIVFIVVLLVAGVVVAVMLTTSATEDKTLSPMHRAIEHIGRWDLRDVKKPAFSWSGSGFRFGLKGTRKAVIRFSHDVQQKIPIHYWVDGEVNYTEIDNKDTIELEFENRTTPHVIQIAKLAESKYGPVRFEGIRVEHNGVFVDLKSLGAKKKRLIEFIGDSLTCGYGVHGKTPDCKFSLQTEDPTVAYAWQIADRLDALPNLVSWSGIGVMCNWENTTFGHEMPNVYRYLFGKIADDEPVWDFKRNQPDAVMMFLGANDDTCANLSRSAFKKAYIKFWDDILNVYYKDLKSLQIVVGCGSNGGKSGGKCVASTICKDVEEAVAEAKNPRVHFVPIFSYATKTCCDNRLLGCASHPNEMGQKFMYDASVQRVADVLGWSNSLDKVPKRDVAASWGASNNAAILSDYCGTESLTDEYTMLMIDGIKEFMTDDRNYSLLHLDSSICNETFENTSLLNCSAIGDSITTCHNRKVKVLLTIGGFDGNISLNSKSNITAIADDLWDTYFGGDSTTRPFGDVSLDGINLDIQTDDEGHKYYPLLVERLRERAGDSDFIVTVTTKNCTPPSVEVDELYSINSTTLIVRYTDSESNCSITHDRFHESIQKWFESALTNSSKVQFLVPSACTETQMYDLYDAVHYAEGKDAMGDRFAGVAFDSVEPAKEPPLYARVLNTHFKRHN